MITVIPAQETFGLLKKVFVAHGGWGRLGLVRASSTSIFLVSLPLTFVIVRQCDSNDSIMPSMRSKRSESMTTSSFAFLLLEHRLNALSSFVPKISGLPSAAPS